MISELILNEEKYKDYRFPGEEAKLTNLNRINIFIGQNNSGKSRFLRRLFVDSHLELINQRKLSEAYSLVKDFLGTIKGDLDILHVTNTVGPLSRVSQIATEGNPNSTKPIQAQVVKLQELASDLAKIEKLVLKKRTGIVLGDPETEKITNSFKTFGNILTEKLQDLNITNYSIGNIYIPILRGLRPIQYTSKEDFDLNMDNYTQRTIKDYFEKLTETHEIFTGLGMYEHTRELLLGDRHGREKIRDFEKFLSKKFFYNKDISIIPHHKKDTLHFNIGHEDLAIYELGDGIQSLIISLYPLFYNQGKNLLIFIEEPENSMHPGLQRLFLETLMREEFKSYQYFITTHSNHFLDISLDMDAISIYSFQKKKMKIKPTTLRLRIAPMPISGCWT